MNKKTSKNWAKQKSLKKHVKSQYAKYKIIVYQFSMPKKTRLPWTLCNGCSLNVLVHMNFKLFKLKPKTHLSSDTIEYEKWMTAHMLCQRVVFFPRKQIHENAWNCIWSKFLLCMNCICFFILYYYQDQLHSDTFKIWIWLQFGFSFARIRFIWNVLRSKNRHNGQMNRKRYTKYILENLQTQQHTERHRM